MHGLVKIAKDRIFHIRPQTQHLRFKSDPAGSPHLGDRVIDPQIPARPFGLAPAILIQGTPAARPPPAPLDHLPQAPLKHRRAIGDGVIDQLLHQSIRPMQRTEDLHRRDLPVIALGDELRRVKYIGIEQLDLITPQLLHMLAAHRPRRLRQKLHIGPVDKPARFLQQLSVQMFAKPAFDKITQIPIHPLRLRQRPGEYPRLTPRLKQPLQQSRHRRQLRLAPGTIGPHNTIPTRNTFPTCCHSDRRAVKRSGTARSGGTC